MKADLSELLKDVPPLLHGSIKESRYCTGKGDSVVISSSESRSQSENKRSCQVKLHSIITEAAKRVVPGETSSAQKQRVQGLSVLIRHCQCLRTRPSGLYADSSQGKGGQGSSTKVEEGPQQQEKFKKRQLL